MSSEIFNIEKKASIQGAESDPGAESRKSDHIQLAFDSQIRDLDQRFDYEPLMAAHPGDFPAPSSFLAKSMKAPIWISSMTGGTEGADSINKRLARACGEFSLGMGLGSCRSLLYSDNRFTDFDVRAEMGDEALLFANLGIAQIEKSLSQGAEDQILRMVDKLRADGLIIHVNPFQEWLQPEGDRITKPPIETIIEFLEKFPKALIVKEVGQGMGPASLEALMQLPLAAIDFGAHGGTNFSKLELLRGTQDARDTYNGLSYVGHRATEMVDTVVAVRAKLHANHDANLNAKHDTNEQTKVKCQAIIASGGVGDYLDGYYLISKLKQDGVATALYGQGSAFLRPAKTSYAALQTYISSQIKGLALAEAYLTVKQ